MEGMTSPENDVYMMFVLGPGVRAKLGSQQDAGRSCDRVKEFSGQDGRGGS